MTPTNPAPLNEIRDSPFWGLIDRLALLSADRHSPETVQDLVRVLDYLLRAAAVVALWSAAGVFHDSKLAPESVITIAAVLGVTGFAPKGEGLVSSVTGVIALVVLWTSRGAGHPTAGEFLYAWFAFGLLLVSGAARWLWGTTFGAPRSTLRAYLLWGLGALGVMLAMFAASGLTLSGEVGESARSIGMNVTSDPAHLSVFVRGDGASLTWAAVVLATLLIVVPWGPLPWRRRTLAEGRDQPCVATELVATGIVWAVFANAVGVSGEYQYTVAAGGAVFGGILWWLVSFVAPARARPRLVVHGCISLAVFLFALGIKAIVDGSAMSVVLGWAWRAVRGGSRSGRLGPVRTPLCRSARALAHQTLATEERVGATAIPSRFSVRSGPTHAGSGTPRCGHAGGVPDQLHPARRDAASLSAQVVTVESIADWRGHDVIDLDGAKVGPLEGVFYDVESDVPVFGLVKTGGLIGRKLSLVALQGGSVSPDHLRVNYQKAEIKDAPHYDADLELTVDQEAGAYQHYGLEYTPVAQGTRRLARR